MIASSTMNLSVNRRVSCGHMITTKASRSDDAERTENGGFCQGQKRPSFVPNCWRNEPISETHVARSEANLFAGAVTCSTQSHP